MEGCTSICITPTHPMHLAHTHTPHAPGPHPHTSICHILTRSPLVQIHTVLEETTTKGNTQLEKALFSHADAVTTRFGVLGWAVVWRAGLGCGLAHCAGLWFGVLGWAVVWRAGLGCGLARCTGLWFGALGWAVVWRAGLGCGLARWAGA